MSVEQQKRSLIEKIATLDVAWLVLRLAQFLDEQTQTIPHPAIRRAVFAKETFPFVADDFDDTLPPGFDDYLLPTSPESKF